MNAAMLGLFRMRYYDLTHLDTSGLGWVLSLAMQPGSLWFWNHVCFIARVVKTHL